MWFWHVRSKVTSHFYYFSVKYLREVTPFIRKSSTSVERHIGWDLKTPFLGLSTATSGEHESSSLEKSNTKSVPLLLSFLTKQTKVTEGKEHHVLEIHSPDRQDCCIFRTHSAHQASQWLLFPKLECIGIDVIAFTYTSLVLCIYRFSSLHSIISLLSVRYDWEWE